MLKLSQMSNGTAHNKGYEKGMVEDPQTETPRKNPLLVEGVG